jgi:hypothetical protein
MDEAGRRRWQLYSSEIRKVGKKGTTLWGERERQGNRASKGDVVVLTAFEHIAPDSSSAALRATDAAQFY